MTSVTIGTASGLRVAARRCGFSVVARERGRLRRLGAQRVRSWDSRCHDEDWRIPPAASIRRTA